MKRTFTAIVSLVLAFTLAIVPIAASDYTVNSEGQLSAAFRTSSDGDTIILGSDITFTSMPEVVNGDLFFDVSTFTLSCDSSPIYVNNSGNLTLRGQGKMTSASGPLFTSVGNLTVDGGWLVGQTFAISQSNTTNAKTVTINGGRLSGGTSAIECSGLCNVVVNGGTINGISCSGGSRTLNSTGDVLEQYTLTLQKDDGTIVKNTAVSAVTATPEIGYTYGVNSVSTDNDGKLYIWLPAGKTDFTVVADGISYAGTVASGVANLREVMPPKVPDEGSSGIAPEQPTPPQNPSNPATGDFAPAAMCFASLASLGMICYVKKKR